MGTATLLVLAMLVANSAAAQDANERFSTAIRALTVGQRIDVTDAAGKRIRGTIARVSPSELTIGDRTLRVSDVQTIGTVGDSKWNGTLIGAAVGGAAGGIGSQGLGEYNSDGVGPLIGFGIAAGAGIGAIVDALINRPVTMSDSKKASVRLRPMIGARRGVVASLKY